MPSPKIKTDSAAAQQRRAHRAANGPRVGHRAGHPHQNGGAYPAPVLRREGLALFAPKVRQTRSDKKLAGRVGAHLLALVCQSPPDEAPAWRLPVLADRLVEREVVEPISTTMVARLLKKTNASLSSNRPSG